MEGKSDTGILSTDVEEALNLASSRFKGWSIDCSTVDIDVESLKNILQKEKEFLKLYEVTTQEPPDKIKKLLVRRRQELAAFDDQLRINENFLFLCKSLEFGKKITWCITFKD